MLAALLELGAESNFELNICRFGCTQAEKLINRSDMPAMGFKLLLFFASMFGLVLYCERIIATKSLLTGLDHSSRRLGRLLLEQLDNDDRI